MKKSGISISITPNFMENLTNKYEDSRKINSSPIAVIIRVQSNEDCMPEQLRLFLPLIRCLNKLMDTT